MTTIEQWWGGLFRGADSPHSWKFKYDLQSATHIQSSSTDEDSTHLRWYSIYDWEKSVYEWTHAFQTCAAEGVVHYAGVFSCLPFFELFSYSPLSAP